MAIGSFVEGLTDSLQHMLTEVLQGCLLETLSLLQSVCTRSENWLRSRNRERHHQYFLEQTSSSSDNPFLPSWWVKHCHCWLLSVFPLGIPPHTLLTSSTTPWESSPLGCPPALPSVRIITALWLLEFKYHHVASVILKIICMAVSKPALWLPISPSDRRPLNFWGMSVPAPSWWLWCGWCVSWTFL